MILLREVYEKYESNFVEYSFRQDIIIFYSKKCLIMGKSKENESVSSSPSAALVSDSGEIEPEDSSGNTLRR
jgi:hypothetical protein